MEMSEGESLGAYLKRVRIARGHTFRSASKLVKCSPGYLTDVENGRRRPSLKMLYQIAVAYDLSFELLRLYGKYDQSSIVDFLKANPYLEDMVLKLASLNWDRLRCELLRATVFDFVANQGWENENKPLESPNEHNQ